MQYGTKLFARHKVEMNHYAVIADCGDPATCLDLAAMLRAVVPSVEPVLTCGDPKAISGQKALLRGPWKLPDASPNPRDRVEVCSRVTACSVRAAVAAGDEVWGACWKAPIEGAGRCAILEGCAEVARCFRDLRAP